MKLGLDTQELNEIQNLDLGVLDSLEAMQSKRDIWLEKRNAKFTVSEYHRLTAGINETAEDAAKRIASGKMLKSEIEALANEYGLLTTGTKYDIAVRLVDAGHIPYGPNSFSQGAETYVTEKVIEQLTGEPAKPFFENDAMRHGKEWEETAAKEFEKRTGIKVNYIGDEQVFIDHKSDYFNFQLPDLIREHVGMTPDSLIGDDAGLETKCPESKTHFEYLQNLQKPELLKEVYPEAYWQIQGSMYLTGRSCWYFVSFDPRFKSEKLRMLILKINRNQTDIEALEMRLKQAVQKKINQLAIYE